MNAKTKAGILGSSDGVTSISGVIAGGAAAHAAGHVLAVTAIGGALAAMVSMGGGELLSEDETDWSAVGWMAAGTVAGGGLPPIPLLFASGWVAVALVVVVSAVIALLVAETGHRGSRHSRGRSYLVTAAVLALGATVGWVAGRYV